MVLSQANCALKENACTAGYTWDWVMTLGLPVQNGVSKSYPYIISASHALYTCTTTVGDNLTFEHIFSLAWVSSETHNLQRVFLPRGVVPYIGYIGMCCAKGYVFFSHFGLKYGINFDHFDLKWGMVCAL